MRALIMGLCGAVACTSVNRTPSSLDAAPVEVTVDAYAGDLYVAVVPDGTGAPPDFPVLPPGPRLLVAPAEVDFGNVNIGAPARELPVVITNAGDMPTAPLSAQLMAVPSLRLHSNCQGRSLMPEETCVVTAQFEPTAVGPQQASAVVDDGAGGSEPVMFTAKGVGRVGPDAGAVDVALPREAGSDVARDTGVDTAVRVDAGVAGDVGAAADTGTDGRG
jgi:hypothetical protein